MSYPTEYWPSYWPTVTSQWFSNLSYQTDQAASCVANTAATCIEVHRERERGIEEQFSHLWIWGNRFSNHYQGNDGLYYAQVMNMLVQDGVPAYHDLPHPQGRDTSSYFYNSQYNYRSWPDYLSAEELIDDVYSGLIDFAMGQRIDSYYEEFNSYDRDLMQQYIYNTGAVLLPIELSDSFDNVGSDGIVPHDDQPNGRGGHALAALGWCYINGELHWICQNSWGYWCGDDGIYYVPEFYDLQYSAFVFTPRRTSPKLNTPVFLSSTVGSTSITVSYESRYKDGEIDPKPTTWHIRCRQGSTGTGDIVEDKYVSSPYNVTFNNLSPNSTYNFVCSAQRSGWESSDYTVRIVLTTEENRPPYFSWTYPKIQGGEFNLTAQEWNDLCDNVNLVEEYKGIGQSNFQTAYTGNKVLATMFNEVRFAIGSMNATGISNQYSGDPILASHLNTIVDKLNAIE